MGVVSLGSVAELCISLRTVLYTSSVQKQCYSLGTGYTYIWVVNEV